MSVVYAEKKYFSIPKTLVIKFIGIGDLNEDGTRNVQSVSPGDEIEANQVICVVEAMKMEIHIAARMAGVVDQVLVTAGQTVKAGELLAVIR
jgi:pyruvate carboxylase